MNKFVYTHLLTHASIQWKSVRRGMTFENDNNQRQVLFAPIGNESNGSFFF